MSTSTQISRIPGNKSRKTDHAEQDLISNLPDCVISHILSCLPMKDAVRTSVLSRYWEYKWTSLREFALHERVLNEYEISDPSFGNFVERTLLLSPNLQSFSIDCFGEYDFRRWITVALNRNVHCLHIECRCVDSFVLPRNLLSCYSLRELHLAAPCTFKVPTKTYFHYLTSLELILVRILNEHSNSDRVEFRFPLLEKLDIILCQWLNIKFVKINAPKLTDLLLSDATNGSNNCSFKIYGDSLMNFSCHEESDQTNVDLSGSAVVHAILESDFAGDDPLLLKKSGLHFRKLLLKRFSSLKELELYGFVAKAMAQSKGLSLPTYYNMERLSLGPLYYTEALLELLYAAPNLKFLYVDFEGLKEYDYDAEESVPPCILSHLEQVVFTSYTGKVNDVKLVKFFLKNAVTLKSMWVHPRSSPKSPMPEEERSVIAKELRTYPKASGCLTISVKGVEEEKLNDDDVLS